MGTPVGLVKSADDYHLFYEYNPQSLEDENYTLGHAVSKDLINWKEQPAAFAGAEGGLNGASCTTDINNALGKQAGEQPTFLLAYGVKNKGIKIAYSTDAGTSWNTLTDKVELTCELTDDAKDPKLMWHEPLKCFVLLVSRIPEGDVDANGISFYTSKNLTDWTFTSHIRGLSGAPDLFRLPLHGDANENKWVLSDAQGNYMLGDFNGKSFSAITSVQQNQGGDFHSPITLQEEGRTIQLAAISRKYIKGSQYNGVLSIPMELQLQKQGEQPIKLVKKPLEELRSLSSRPVLKIRNKKLIPGLNDNPMKRLKGVSTHINGVFDLNNVDAFGFLILNSRKEDGTELMYNAKKNTISWKGTSIDVNPVDNRIEIEIFIDKSTVEIFINGGEQVISSQIEHGADNDRYVLAAQGGELLIETLNAQVRGEK